MIPRKQLTIVAIVGSVIIICLGVWSFYEHRKSPAYSTTTVNKDTGQTIINLPNQSPETNGNKQPVTILGEDKLINAGMTEDQLSLTSKLLTSYDTKQLGYQYTELSILNDGFSSTGTQITASMRLGNSSELLKLTINYHNLTFVEVIISDPAGNTSYSYDSGEQQASDNSTVLPYD